MTAVTAAREDSSFVWGRQKAREWIGLRTSCGLVTGSPFPPVSYGGRSYTIAQSNNALVFPGLGLGVAVVRARRITDAMIAAAAYAVAALTDPTGPGAALLPPVTDLRTVSAAVAIAVAQAAEEQGLAEQPLTDPVKQIHQAMWRPEYPAIEPI